MFYFVVREMALMLLVRQSSPKSVCNNFIISVLTAIIQNAMNLDYFLMQNLHTLVSVYHTGNPRGSSLQRLQRYCP